MDSQSFRQHYYVTVEKYVADLVGELQDMQSATNTSTAADLLKQGAGTT